MMKQSVSGSTAGRDGKTTAFQRGSTFSGLCACLMCFSEEKFRSFMGGSACSGGNLFALIVVGSACNSFKGVFVTRADNREILLLVDYDVCKHNL